MSAAEATLERPAARVAPLKEARERIGQPAASEP